MHNIRHLVVDGHSVIFHFRQLRELHSRKRQAARQKLINALNHLQDYSGIRVHLVFDGNTGGGIGDTETNAISIRYASSHATADSIIERAIGAAPNPTEIAVVTADLAEAAMISSLGAATFSPDDMLCLIRQYCPDWVAESLENS